MKNIFLLIVIAICINFYSCETEEAVTPQDVRKDDVRDKFIGYYTFNSMIVSWDQYTYDTVYEAYAGSIEKLESVENIVKINYSDVRNNIQTEINTKGRLTAITAANYEVEGRFINDTIIQFTETILNANGGVRYYITGDKSELPEEISNR